jgi:hypothetical protein
MRFDIALSFLNTRVVVAVFRRYGMRLGLDYRIMYLTPRVLGRRFDVQSIRKCWRLGYHTRATPRFLNNCHMLRVDSAVSAV